MATLPQLPSTSVQQVFLPDPPGVPEDQQGWVKMDVSPINVRDFIFTESSGATSASVVGKEFSLNMLAERIKEWNYTDEGSQEVLPITPDNVMRLGQQNILFLYTQYQKTPVSGLSTAEKKTSSSTSTDSVTAPAAQ